MIQKATCSPAFTAALSTAAETCEQANCPSAGEWMKTRCVCAVAERSATQQNEITPSEATWMDLEMIILSEVGQTKTDTI